VNSSPDLEASTSLLKHVCLCRCWVRRWSFGPKFDPQKKVLIKLNNVELSPVGAVVPIAWVPKAGSVRGTQSHVFIPFWNKMFSAA
jgi:hypothetical protein